MAYNHERKNKSKRFCIKIVLAVAVIFCGWVVLWYYAPHLLWKYAEWRYDLHEVEKIETVLMPEVDIPENWVEHSFKNMHFRLSPDMSPVEEDLTGSIFWSENMVFRLFPMTYPDLSEILRLASRLHPEHKHFTLTQLYFESLKAGASDFHWSMSRQEALWHCHMVCVVRSVFPGSYGMRSAEFFSGKNWEGLLFFPKEKELDYDRWMLEWHCMYCSNSGLAYFSTPIKSKDKELAMSVVRGIIQSIEIDCGCSSDEE